MKSFFISAVAMLAMCSFSWAKDPLPDAPSEVVTANEFIEVSASQPTSSPITTSVETRPVSPMFLSLAVISTGSAFADSYTTLFARQNWLAGKTGVCNVEVESAYLYGAHPTVGRAYAVASAKSAGSILAAYYLRRHHNKFWSLPLVANTLTSLQGVTQNMMTCN